MDSRLTSDSSLTLGTGRIIESVTSAARNEPTSTRNVAVRPMVPISSPARAGPASATAE